MQPTPCAVQKVKDDMSGPAKSGAGGGTEPPPRRNDLPPEIKEIIWPALQVGGLSGTFLPALLLIPKSLFPLLHSSMIFLTRANG
jgi:hypothetical protein